MFKMRLPNAGRKASCLLALYVFTAACLGGTNSTWVNPADGDWTNPTNWSTNPSFPNNGFPTAADTYDAVISAEGLPYTVTTNAAAGSITVDSLTLDSSSASLNLNAGTFRSINGVTINNGSLRLAGATIRNTVIGGSGGQFIPSSGVLDGTTLRRDAYVPNNARYGDPAGLVVRNGLTLDGGTFNLHQQESAATYTGIQFDGTQTLAGSGRFLLDGDRAPFMRINGNLTIGAGVTIEGRSEFNYFQSTVTNLGTIRARPGAGDFWLENAGAGTFINRGLVEAASGGRVRLEGSFSNSAGIIRASGGTVDIGTASYKTSDLGTLELLGGSISLGGTIDNNLATITVPSSNGAFYLDGTVNNGTLASVPGAQFTVPRNATIKGSKISGNIGIEPRDSLSGSVLSFINMTLNGGKIYLRSVDSGSGSNAILRNASAVPGAIGGSGEIIFDNFDLNELSGGNLSLGAGITIRTGSGGGIVNGVVSQGHIVADNPNRTISLFSSQNAGTMDLRNGNVNAVDTSNRGTITNDGGALKLSGIWTNEFGTIRALNGSTVTLFSYPTAVGSFAVANSTLGLAGPLTSAQLEAISISSSVIAMEQNGVLNNANQTLTLGSGNSFHFRGGRVNGGTLASASAEPYSVDALGYVNGVTLAVPLTINPGAFLTAESSLTLQKDISINSDSQSGGLSAPGATLSGAGNIVFLGKPASGAVNGFGMVIGPDIAIRTGTGDGRVGLLGAPFTNQGLISSASDGLTLSVAGTNWTNDASGKLEAGNKGVMAISGSWSNKGAIRAFNNGVININAGPMSNLTGASATAESGGVIHLNTNSGLPATASAAARVNLKIHIMGFGTRLVLGADQDVGDLDLDLNGAGNPGIDLNSSGAAPRRLRVHPTDFDSAWSAMDAAIRAYLATGDRGIFDSNLRPGARVAMIRQIDLHSDPMIVIGPARIGDVNFDNNVTIADFIDLASHFGMTNATWREGDLNGDGLVNIGDFMELSGNFNTTYAGESFPISAKDQLLLSNFAVAHAGEVPEPGAGVVAGLIALLAFRRMRITPAAGPTARPVASTIPPDPAAAFPRL